MIKSFAIGFFTFTLLAGAGTLWAQQNNNPVTLPQNEAQHSLTDEEKVFYNRYMNPRSGRFNPRARAVVNPRPYPRPALSPVYPDYPGVSETSFRQWELSNHNWRRVSNAYDPGRPVKYCGYCSYWQ